MLSDRVIGRGLVGAALLVAALGLPGCGGGDPGSQNGASASSSQSGGLARGAQVFKLQCAVCHGDTGHGDGMGAAALPVRPRNLTSEPYKYVDIPGHDSEAAALEAYIKDGRIENGMPPFGHLPESDLLAVAEYVRSLRPKPNFVDGHAAEVEAPSSGVEHSSSGETPVENGEAAHNGG